MNFDPLYNDYNFEGLNYLTEDSASVITSECPGATTTFAKNETSRMHVYNMFPLTIVPGVTSDLRCGGKQLDDGTV